MAKATKKKRGNTIGDMRCRRESTKEAYDALHKWLRMITTEQLPPLIDDGLLTYCKGCGKGAWLIEDIEHKRNCEVFKMFQHLETLKTKN